MVIEAYSGFTKKHNSTKQPSGSGTQINVKLKDGTSILKPHFRLHNYSFAHNYIKWGSRYYFVDDIISLSNNEAEYVCSSDPMATFKSDIGSSSQYVLRSASAFDGAVMDDKYPTTAEVTNTPVNLTNISAGINIANGTYVLGLKSKEADAGVAFYAMDNAEFASFVQFLYTGGWLDATDISVSLQKMLIDPFDYVVSCNWYPFTITGTSTSVYFGYWDWTGQSMSRIDENSRIKFFNHAGQLPDHPQVSRGSYLNASPFTRLECNLYSFGRFVLDPNRFLESRSFNVQMAIDLFTGIGTARVSSSTGIIFESCATCGVPIQLSQVKGDLVRPLIQTAGAVASYVKQNYVGAAAGISDAVRSALPQITSVGSVGSIAAYYGNPPRIDAVHYAIANEDNAQIGRPLCAQRTISTLSGYIQCEDADLDTAAAPSEKDEIISYMNNGFYYE